MPANSNPQARAGIFDPRLLEQLACPVCFGALQLDSSSEQINCVKCQRAYPLIDGIPVLIPGRVIQSV